MSVSLWLPAIRKYSIACCSLSARAAMSFAVEDSCSDAEALACELCDT
jgi:hypothetical protein